MGAAQPMRSAGTRPGFASWAASALACALAWNVGPAFAQAVPSGPIAPTREEIERPAPEPVEARPPSLRVEGEIERAPCALDRPEYRDIHFTPTEVQFDDLKGLAPDALRPAWEPYVGREQPLSIICEIRDRAATILRDAGYIASVEVPEQRIAEGRIRFQVLMARLVAIRVRGDAGRAERMIAGYLQPLTQEEVFNRHRAERQLLLASDLPGYSVRLALRSAGAARGEVIGEVTVLRTPFTADATIQNLGSRDLGRWGAMVRGQFFGLTGLGDRTIVSAFTTADFEEQQTLQIAHDFRLGSSGLTLAGQFTYAWAEPDLGDPTLRIQSKTSFATIEASYPFIRTQAHSLRAAIGLDIVGQDVEFNGLALSRDRLRVAFLRLVAEAVDSGRMRGGFSLAAPRWRLGSSIELRRGLDILDATNRCSADFLDCLAPGRVPPSRLEGDPTATVIRATAQGEFRPVPRLTLALGARAQYADQPLLSFEEFSAGNYTVGRGYDPGALIGDKGAGLQAEIRFGTLVSRTNRSLAAEPYVFVDQAWVKNEDRFIGFDRAQELTSVGGGVRASFGGQVFLDLSLAVPLDRIEPLGRKPDPRLLFSLTSRLWPWSL